MTKSLYDYCIENNKQTLLEQWDKEKNYPLTPQDVSYGSRKEIWWRCEQGHKWRASIRSRVIQHAGCPYCTGKKVVSGENDLAAMYPEIAAQWIPEKNAPLTPENTSPNSNRRVWWRCELGHEWQTIVAHRTNSHSGCPYCTGRKVLPGFNDLASKDPKLAEQWHPELNGELTAQMVTTGCNKRVWWQCAKGHVWKAAIYSRATGRKSGCPVCAGKVKSHNQK